MQYKAFAVFAALAAIGATQDIDNNDVPSVCRSVCQSTVDLTTQCDRQNDDNDTGFINCVCSSSNASSFIPECEACVAANDEADNDVRDIVRSCSFTQVSTWNSAATGTATSGSASLTSATAVTTGSGSVSGSTTGSTTGSSATGQTTGTTATSTGSTGATAAQSTGAAAPAVTAGLGGLAVAILAGVPALL
ncbi:hypothetical protein MPH_08946 [Macrophomina phaseolina MS6]|uniref:Gpi anchored protein n=1 Tax=Macrophomina phaseolina (strain MS6) TaxID=1126212 RepID=K2RMA6_MACPH|nr:hypothetical protein MPH_08946 [Macrophomina phaseolina MS6]